MEKEILDFYLKTSIFTNYGPYKKYFQSLPDDMEELTSLLLEQTIHRKTLIRSSIMKNEVGASLEGIAEEYPWWGYRSHDDILLTVPAIMSELNRLDERGIFHGREISKKVVITCRYVAILLASILKAKGIPTRVRSGFATYLGDKGKSCDHWIIEYYKKEENRWVICDPYLSSGDMHTDMNSESFGWIAKIWLDVRSGKDSISNYIHGSCFQGLDMLARSLFYDFHALMNDEVSYLFFPTYIDSDEEFLNLSIEELKELDDLATLMLNPDKNFSELLYIFNNDKKFRALNTPLLSDFDHQESEITYKILDKSNFELAKENYTKIFPEAKESLEALIERNVKYYLAYLNHQIIGMIGFHLLEEYPDDIFINHLGILPNFKNNGLGKRLFLDAIQLSYQSNKKFLRILLNENIHSSFESLCKQFMDIKEDYNLDMIIYSKSLTKAPMVYWNNRFLEIENKDRTILE